MKHLILFTLTVLSINSMAAGGESSSTFGKDCQRIISKSADVRSSQLSAIVHLALRSCYEMPNRETVATALEAANSAPASTRFELLRRLSARFVVYVESKVFGRDINSIDNRNVSAFNLFSRDIVAQYKLNEAADLIGISEFSYDELRNSARLDEYPEAKTGTVLMRLTRLLYEQIQTP